MKTYKIILEEDQTEVLSKRKKEKGITLDFQLREAVKMYVELINKRANENN